ncbi:MAG: GNAT family N-acetyltransferase [Bacteroidota bacterium]
MSYSLLPLTASDHAFLKQMFYAALFVPPGKPLYAWELLEEPHLAKYWVDWGRPTDAGWIAVQKAEQLGAVWTRFFSRENAGYGFVREDIPELGIALVEGMRGKGLGTRLMQKMMATAQEKGWSGLSLSADTRNQAVRLYEKLGFQEVKTEGTSITMCLTF